MNTSIYRLITATAFVVLWSCAPLTNLQTHLQAQTPRDTTVIIRGKKFAPGVEVYYDSAGVRKRLDSTRVRRIDSRTIESMIPGWLLNVPGRYPITLQNPSPSRGVSNADTLTIARGNTPVRTDTALWFRYTSNERIWHEYIEGSINSRADSIFILTSGNPIIEKYTVSGIFFRNGSFQLTTEKENDPLMAKYTSPSVQMDGDSKNRERIEIDGISSPVKAKIYLANGDISEQSIEFPSVRPLIDALAANIVQQYPNTLAQGDTTTSKILVAISRTEGHTVTPITGQGRFKIVMNTLPANLLGFTPPPDRQCIIRVDTQRNYIESVELKIGNLLESATYQKLRDDSQPSNPQVELVMTEQYYTLPDSNIKMKFIQTKHYQSLAIKNYVTQKPVIPATR
jgi:hypothetical protein